jgi:hypothetical protein
MYPSGIRMVLKHLASMGEYRFANKIASSIKTGKVLDMTPKERSVFNVVKMDLLKSTKEQKLIQPGVMLRRELSFNPYGGVKKGGAISRGYYSGSKNVPMIDIDLPDPRSHMGGQIMFKTKKEAMQNFSDFMKTKFGKKTAWKLYDTPAGIRMFDISKKSRKAAPSFYEGVSQELGGDPFYIKYSRGRGTYDARLFPKPGRTGDYVARPLIPNEPRKIILGPDATVSRKSWDEVRNVHDKYIENILNQRKRTGKISLGGLFDLINLTTI